MSDSPRILMSAFDTVPGLNACSNAVFSVVSVVDAEVDVVSRKTGGLAHQGRLGHARVFRVPCSGTVAAQHAALGRALLRQVESTPYDVVHATGAEDVRLVRELREEMGFRLIYEVARLSGDDALGQEAFREDHARLCELADQIWVPSRAALLRPGFRAFGAKVRVVPPGVDLDAYGDDIDREGNVTPRLLYLGSFASDCDVSVVVDALVRLKMEIPFEALLAGEPDPVRVQEMQAMVKAVGLADCVRVQGEPRIAFVPRVIASATIGIVAAGPVERFFEFGLMPEPCLEFCAQGCPIVAPAIPAIEELTSAGASMVLYSPGSATSLFEALRALLTHHEYRSDLAAGARAYVHWAHGGGQRRRRVRALYNELLGVSAARDAWDDAFSDPDDWTTTPSALSAIDRVLQESPTQSSYWPIGRGESGDVAFRTLVPADFGSSTSALGEMVEQPESTSTAPAPKTVRDTHDDLDV